MARPAITADEKDAFGSGQHALIWRPGERKAIKRSANRRDRRHARRALHAGIDA